MVETKGTWNPRSSSNVSSACIFCLHKPSDLIEQYARPDPSLDKVAAILGVTTTPRFTCLRSDDALRRSDAALPTVLLQHSSSFSGDRCERM